MSAKLEGLFPRLISSGYALTSSASARYNCIAWAAEDMRHWWWPDEIGVQAGVCYWPAGVPMVESLDAFIQAFQTLGYQPCDGDHPEPGYEKLAVYVNADGKPTHAARQLPNGRWTSKLGSEEDIEHSLDGLAGALYGTVGQILKRRSPLAESEVTSSD